RVAGVGGAGVAVVAVGRRARRAAAGDAGLEPVAYRSVGARGSVGDRGVDAAGGRIAGVGGARIAIVAVRCRARGADAALTGLRPVAGVAVRARRPVQHRGVLAARGGVAGVHRARVQIVAVEGDAVGARARLAGLVAVADRGVGARAAVGYGGVGATRDR